MDRPLPWATDCDCCFVRCPEAHACTRLYETGLYVACRGDSIGKALEATFRAHPALALASAALALVAGGRALRRAVWLPGRRAR